MKGSGRILFVGGLRAGGNGPDWLRAIERQGFEVTPFDTKAYSVGVSRLESAIARRTGISRHIVRLNQEVTAIANSTRFDIAFVTKGIELKPVTIRQLVARAERGSVLHLTIDSMFIDNCSRHFFASIPHYTALMTDKRFEERSYRAAGAQKLIFFDQPYGLRFDNEGEIAAARKVVPGSDVCFVGHYQRHYAEVLREVAAMDVDLKIWGPGWRALARSESWARSHVMGEGLWGANYPAALSKAKIGLGLLSKRIPEEATTRSVEIPAAGALLLAERSERHASMYREDTEAVFFGSSEELRGKITQYLRNEKGRVRIAAAGAARARSAFNMNDTVRHLMTEARLFQANKSRFRDSYRG